MAGQERACRVQGAFRSAIRILALPASGVALYKRAVVQSAERSCEAQAAAAAAPELEELRREMEQREPRVEPMLRLAAAQTQLEPEALRPLE